VASYQNVVVGTDGSESSFRAVDRAAAVAKDTGAKLYLVSAFRPVSERDRERAAAEIGSVAFRVEATDLADEALRGASDRAILAGATDVEKLALAGDPVDVLLDAISTTHADLLVVGNRGLNSLSGRILGSVPQSVAHKAACDVLIVHTTD